MSENHNGGNAIPEITREEHDGLLNAKRTSLVSTVTIYAVVNTSAPGVSNSIVTIANTPLSTQIVGNVTLSGPLPTGLNNIGFATVAVSTPTIFAVVNTSAPGITNSIVTVANTVAVTFSGNVTLSDAKTYIGLVTSTIGNSPVLGSGVGNIGFATVNQVNQPALVAGAAYIGLASVNIGGSLPAGVNGIGFATVNQVNQPALVASSAFIGLATTVNGAGTRFIGLVTAWTRNAGSAKTLVPVPFAFGASVATIAVPTNANVMYITNMILSANATTQVRMKSGVTYMTGNASIGISLNPNGGYVLTGSPDSPSWIGCPSGAVVLEKNDATTLVGGHLIYFQE